MTPGKLNLTCPQGATFSKVLQLFDSSDVALPLAGYTAAMQVRQTYASKTTLVALTVGDGIALVDNKIYLSIPAADTALFKSGNYVYDLELTDGSGKVDRLIEGKFVVTPGVTK